MTKYITSSFLLFLGLTLLGPGFLAAADASPLEGIWVNTNPETRSSPKIEIEIGSDGTASFIWWGKTHPENSKYGPFPLKLYGRSTGDKSPPAYGKAVHETTFSDMLFTLEMDGGYLKVSMFTEFKDDSGRKPYCVKMTFKKE